MEYGKGWWKMDGRMVGKTSGRLVVDGFIGDNFRFVFVLFIQKSAQSKAKK